MHIDSDIYIKYIIMGKKDEDSEDGIEEEEAEEKEEEEEDMEENVPAWVRYMPCSFTSSSLSMRSTPLRKEEELDTRSHLEVSLERQAVPSPSSARVQLLYLPFHKLIFS